MSENYFYSSLTGQEIEDTLLGAVVCNANQNLTTSEKAQARANIGAGEANTSFKIMGYFATMEDLQNSLTALPEPGDAYGVSVSPTPASEYLSPDGTQTQFTLSESPYYITVTDTGTSTVLTPDEDYTYIDGVVTFPSAPAAGTNSYLVEWDDPTAPYDIYVWDALANAWVDNGQLIAADIIDDTETSNVLTWSSSKINSTKQDKITAVGILKGSGSAVSAATLGTDYTAVDDSLSTSAAKTYSVDKINSLTSGLVSYAEDQTGTISAAQAEQARSNIQAARRWELLWTNQNPTSDFAAQTIEVDNTSYDFYLFILKRTKSDTRITSVIAPKGYGSLVQNMDTAKFIYRNIYVSTSPDPVGFQFSDGFQVPSYGATSSPTSNNFLIPLYIIGIKG